MPDLLTALEAAAILEVSDETLRRWAAAGLIRYIRLPSGQLRFERGDIDAIRTPIEPVVTELRWRWRAWRADHYVWLAQHAWIMNPTPCNRDAYHRALDYRQHIQVARP